MEGQRGSHADGAGRGWARGQVQSVSHMPRGSWTKMPSSLILLGGKQPIGGLAGVPKVSPPKRELTIQTDPPPPRRPGTQEKSPPGEKSQQKGQETLAHWKVLMENAPEL